MGILLSGETFINNNLKTYLGQGKGKIKCYVIPNLLFKNPDLDYTGSHNISLIKTMHCRI